MNDIWQRVRRVFSARSHAAVDELEDPGPMLNQMQRELVAALGQARVALNQACAWRVRLQRQLEQAQAHAESAGAAARRALEQDDEAMARRAIERRQARAREGQTLTRQIEQAGAVVEAQRQRVEDIKEALVELRDKRAELMHRSRFARAAGAMGAAVPASGLAGLGAGPIPEPIGEVVARMEEKVAAEEALASVMIDGAACGEPGERAPSLDDYMRDQAVESEFEALRRSMSATCPP